MRWEDSTTEGPARDGLHQVLQELPPGQRIQAGDRSSRITARPLGDSQGQRELGALPPDSFPAFWAGSRSSRRSARGQLFVPARVEVRAETR